jgi:hypothetical protein
MTATPPNSSFYGRTGTNYGVTVVAPTAPKPTNSSFYANSANYAAPASSGWAWHLLLP